MSKPKSFTSYTNDLADSLEQFFVGSLPALPNSLKEFIVQVSPYLIILLTILLLPFLLAGLGIGTLFLPFSFIGGIGYGFTYIIALVFAFGAFILQIMAVPGLFKRTGHAWRLVYYATLLTIVNNVFSANLVSAAISGFISFYFLFQLKSKYGK